MKTNYPLDKIVRRRNDGRRRFWFALSILALISLVVSVSPTIRSGLSMVAITVTRPLWVTEQNTLVFGGDLFSFFRTKKGLVEDNRRLRQEAIQLKASLVSKELIEKEYNDVSAIVGRTNKKETPIVGKVLVKPGRTPYDIVVVDVGANNVKPVKVGYSARLADDVTIGKVVEVTGDTARVELFSSPGVTTEVLIGASRIQATSTGQGGGSMLVTLPRGAAVAHNDYVVLPTSKRQVIGVVADITADPSEPIQKIAVRLPVNIYQLSWLELYAP